MWSRSGFCLVCPPALVELGLSAAIRHYSSLSAAVHCHKTLSKATRSHCSLNRRCLPLFRCRPPLFAAGCRLWPPQFSPATTWSGVPLRATATLTGAETKHSSTRRHAPRFLCCEQARAFHAPPSAAWNVTAPPP